MTTPEPLGEAPVPGAPAPSPQHPSPPAGYPYPPSYPPAQGYPPAHGYPPVPPRYGPPVPPRYGPPVPSGKKPLNVLGLISVIVGGLGFVLACLSFALMSGGWVMVPVGMLLLTGFVLAIVALFRKGQGKGLGIAGLIVSIVGSIVGFVMLVTAITFAVGGAFVSETGEMFDSIEEQAEEEPQAPSEPFETPPGDLLPAGSTVTSEDWEVTVNSVALAQTDVVLAVNAYNEEPEPGYEYILVNVTTTYIGDRPDGEMPGFVSFDYVSASGEVTPPPLLLIPDELDRISNLQQGGSATGNIVLVAPIDTAADGAIAVTPGLMDDPVFVAVQ